MKILVACEESGRVTAEFRRLGHEAYSCDILPTSGGHPEWHIQGDVLPLLKQKWDMIIAFPPCTYLTYAGNRHYSLKCSTPEKIAVRKKARSDAYKFFMMFANANCKRIAIENPLGYMNKHYRKPDQIIQPYMFGDPVSKRTCLWLKGLPKLHPTKLLPKPEPMYICQGEKCKGKKLDGVKGCGQVLAGKKKEQNNVVKPSMELPALWLNNGAAVSITGSLIYLR